MKFLKSVKQNTFLAFAANSVISHFTMFILLILFNSFPFYSKAHRLI